MIKTKTKLRGKWLRDLNRFEAVVVDRVCLSGVAAMARVVYEAARDYADRSYTGIERRPHMFRGRNGVNYGPFMPGNLKAAIYRVYVKERSQDRRKIYHVAWNHKKAPYGFMVEYGTPRAPAYPFMRPAFGHIDDAISAGRVSMRRRLATIRAEAKAGNDD